MTRGGVPSLRELYTQDYSKAAEWYEIYVREAHPGENYPAPGSFEEKMAHARDFKRLEDIPWPVLVDDLDGTVHRAYGELPNSAYVINAEGRIAFKDQWASAPTLRTALDELRECAGRCAPVAGGVERTMSMLGPMAFGWHAIQRAGNRAVRDLVLKAPPLAAMLYLGHLMQPAIAPAARRTKPVAPQLKTGVMIGVGALLAVFISALALIRRR